jgi:hypothetical protein
MQFAICINNEGYKASLEAGKLYPVIHNPDAAAHGYIKITDETGEDYAFAAERFHIIELPLAVEKTLLSVLQNEYH